MHHLRRQALLFTWLVSHYLGAESNETLTLYCLERGFRFFAQPVGPHGKIRPNFAPPRKNYHEPSLAMRGRAKRGPSFPGSFHGNFCEGARNLVEFCHEDQLAVHKNTEPPLKAIAVAQNMTQKCATKAPSSTNQAACLAPHNPVLAGSFLWAILQQAAVLEQLG